MAESLNLPSSPVGGSELSTEEVDIFTVFVTEESS